MATRVIYFGNDSCHRLPVLTAAGFSVEHCPSLAVLGDALSAAPEPRAVFFCDHQGRLPHDAILLVRTHPGVLVILFRETNQQWNEAEFDLVIPILTPPHSWLGEIELLLENPVLHRPRRVHSQPATAPAGFCATETAPPTPPGPASVTPHAALPDGKSFLSAPDNDRSIRTA